MMLPGIHALGPTWFVNFRFCYFRGPAFGIQTLDFVVLGQLALVRGSLFWTVNLNITYDM